jgi:hypothetical protein
MILHRNSLLLLAVLTIGVGYLAAALTTETPCSSEWEYADLAAIDPVDANRPENDMIALYGRICDGALEIRLDLLQGTAYQSNLEISLETSSRHWLIELPAGEDMVGLSGKTIDTSATRYPELDAVTLRINDPDLPKRLDSILVQASTISPDNNDTLDQIGPIQLGGPPPLPAPLMLVFWDTFSAATPADGLRSWNGAHTGPLGQRHGLQLLLQAASEHDIPVTLLDLKTSAALSVLDTVGGLPMVRQMEQEGLLILPDSATGSPETASTALDLSREAAARFGLKASRTAYGPLPLSAPVGYEAAFSSLTLPNRISHSEGMRWIPLPAQSSGEENTSSGLNHEGKLSLQTRQDLLEAALSDERYDLVTLGGSLPTALWADVYAAPTIMAYLAGHPWIAPLKAADLLTFASHKMSPDPPAGCRDLLCSASNQPILPTTTTGKPYPENLNHLDLQDILRDGLPPNPQDSLALAAWQSFFQITQATTNLQQQALQANNLDAAAHLLAAADWTANPSPLSSCSTDLDHDGLPECQLASTSIYAAIETDDGRLALLVYKNGNQTAQIVGPTSQFAVGLSDPGEWQLEFGSAADRDATPGGFITSKPPYPVYSFTLEPERLTLSDPADSIQKTYSLLPDGLLVEISSDFNTSTEIPLLLTGGLPTAPGWANQLRSTAIFTAEALQWQFSNGLQAEITISGASFTTSTFFDSLEWMSAPEDPNLFYTPGHQLPYPFAITQIVSSKPYEIRFIFRP